MARGRPPLAEPRVSREISLPQGLAAAVDARLGDAFTKKPRYGAWSALATTLLKKWLAESTDGAPT